MEPDGINRRDFLQNFASGTAAAILATSPATSTSRGGSDSGTPTFGTPIEEAFNKTTSEERTLLGSLTDRSLFVCYQSWNRGGTTSSSIIAKLNQFTGSTDWSKTIDDYAPAPRESKGRLYFAGLDSVECWNATTGEEIWSQELAEEVIGVGYADEQILVHGWNIRETRRDGEQVTEVTDSKIYSLNPETGSTQWSSSFDNALYPDIVTDELIICTKTDFYLTDDDEVYDSGQIVSLNKSDGDIAWESDFINPESIYNLDETILVSTFENEIYLLSFQGDEIFSSSKEISTFYITESVFLLASEEGGIVVYDHNGVKQTSQPLYPDINITDINSSHTSDSFLLSTDEDKIIAIDDSSYTERSRISQRADTVAIQYEIAFIIHDTNQITVVDIDTGGVVCNTTEIDAESLRVASHDGLFYIYGDRAPLRAYSGRRGRAMAALDEVKTTNSVAKTISNLAPGGNNLSNAETALEQGNYDEVHQLLDEEGRRQLTINGALGATGLATIYGTGRVGATKWRQKQLRTAIDRVDTFYPINKGALAGVEPTDFLAQGRVARDALDSKTGISVRQVISDDYGDLLQTLTQLADRHNDLISASDFLANADKSLLPESIIKDIRTAVEQGEIQQLGALLHTVETAEDLLDRLQALSETVDESSFSISTEGFYQLIEKEISEQSRSKTGAELVELISELKNGIKAVEGYQNRVGIFDISQKRRKIQDALDSPNNLTESEYKELQKYPKLLEAAQEFETQFAQTDFDAINVPREEFEGRAQAMFAQLAVDELASLAKTLKQMRVGRWSHSDLFSTSPIEFEYLIGALFADMGYEVTVSDARGDKGIDVVARSTTETLVIQVKQHSRGNNVGRPTVQKTVGAMSQVGGDKAIIVTSAGFTDAAIEASRDFGNIVELIDGKELVQLLTESRLHPQSSASEYRSQARSSSSWGSASQSNRYSSTTVGQPRTMSESQAYDILDIDPPASESEIESRYRQKVKETHPDVGGSVEEFKNTKEAFTVLSEDE